MRTGGKCMYPQGEAAAVECCSGELWRDLRRDERVDLEVVGAGAEVLRQHGLRLPACVQVAVCLEGCDELQVLGGGAVLRAAEATVGRGAVLRA
mgnify:CR=1 FL=1